LKTKTLGKETINIITLGCPKNLVDSEHIASQLKASEINVLHDQDPNDSKVIILNTCGFIDKAKEESINTILELVNAKEAGKISKLYVAGCLIERYQTELQNEIANVDGWFGLHEIPNLIKRVGADYKNDLIGDRLLSTPAHYAYLKISEGCDRNCSFCTIPSIRGKQISHPIEKLIDEAKRLASNGVKELILVAQELTSYGIDIYGKRKLPELLEQLSKSTGIEWIRLHYAYPAGFPLEILDIIKENSNICNYLDLPLQHVSNPILKKMGRQITKERIEQLIVNIRQKIPEISLRTTMLVGFPGETEDNIKELIDFIGDNRFERLGVFEYSHEDGTKAFGLKDDVPPEIKKLRAEKIMELQQEVSLEVNKAKITKSLRVLFDREEGDHLIGRTEFDSPEIDNEVIVEKNGIAKVGEFGQVAITEATEFDLYGTLI